MGRGKYGKKSTPSQLGEGVCEQGEGGAWFEETSSFEQSPSWKMGVEICSCQGGDVETCSCGKIWARGIWVEN